MSGNAAIDIAIGLVLMYLVLSLMATVLNEMVASAMKWRAATLQSAILSIIDDPTLRADFYDHGVIDGTKDAVGGHTSYLSGRAFATALLGSVDPTKPVPEFSDVEQAIKQMPDCNIRDVLLSHVATAQGDLTAFRNEVAKYFDSAMDRVSGVYQRKLKLLSLIIAAVVAIVLNADTLQVGRALWRDSSLRAQIVQTADTMLKSAPPGVVQNEDAPKNRQAHAPVSTQAPRDTMDRHEVSKTPTGASQSSQPQILANEGTVGAASDPIRTLQNLDERLRPLPIGWSLSGLQQLTSGSSLDAAGRLGMKLIGLLLTALAVSLGAPFWFDTLSKFMNVRGAGEKPKRTVSAQ